MLIVIVELIRIIAVLCAASLRGTRLFAHPATQVEHVAPEAAHLFVEALFLGGGLYHLLLLLLLLLLQGRLAQTQDGFRHILLLLIVVVIASAFWRALHDVNVLHFPGMLHKQQFL